MDCFIVGLLPSPVAVHNGGARLITVTYIAMKPLQNAFLQIDNLQPAGADVTLDGDVGDIVHSAIASLAPGQSQLTYTLGLTLTPTNANSGAIIGLIARVVRSRGGAALSPDFSFLGVIGATAAPAGAGGATVGGGGTG
jgi:hypothetical protein